MRFEVDPEELRSLIVPIIEEVIARTEAVQSQIATRLAYPEDEAAGLLGVKPHVLRDLRLKGEIKAARIGKRIVYPRESLLQLLEDKRWR